MKKDKQKSKIISSEELRLCELIAEALGDTEKEEKDININWQKLMELATHQAVLSIVYDKIKKFPLSQEQRMFAAEVNRSIAMEFYQILFAARDTIRLLERDGISVVLLKGASAARFYPVMEARKSSDIDLLLTDTSQMELAAKVLFREGYTCKEKQIANHHQVWGTPANYMLELHTMIVEPFDNKNMNHYIKTLFQLSPEQILITEILGINFPVLPDSYLAFHLLLHMLQDFLRAGFGLKLLCDWVVFWNQKVEAEDIHLFLRFVKKCRLTGFLSVITSVSVAFLGLRTDGTGSFLLKNETLTYQDHIFCNICSQALCEDFLKEIIEAEREGKPSSNRVVALRGTQITDYIREFHHQTVLQFPKAVKCKVLFPMLYIVSLIKFLYNNHSRRNQSLWSVLETTKERSRLVKEMNIFQR